STRGRKRSFRRVCNLRRWPIAGVQWPPCRASVFPLKLLTRTAGLSFRAAGTFFCLRRRDVNGVLPQSRNTVARGRAESFTALRAESARRDPNARQSEARDARHH